MRTHSISRRHFLAGSAAGALALAGGRGAAAGSGGQAQIAITLDLEMSQHYPRRGMFEWNYEKGNLDEPTKEYAVQAARIVKDRGGRMHFFCVGRVLEQPNVDWLKEIADGGHAIGNHTYDHVNVKATEAAETQFRFQRAPWLVAGRTAAEVIRENIRLTNVAIGERAGIKVNGFRTPGGFGEGLADRPDVQQMLLDLGFGWVSSKYPPFSTGEPHEQPTPEVYATIVKAQQAAQPFVYPSGLIEIPMAPISDVNAFRTLFWTRDSYLRAIRQATEWAIRTGGVFDFLAHPSCLVVEDPKFEVIHLICDLVEQAGEKAALVDLNTIAQRVGKTGG